jgi:hypothetical protein
MILALCPTKIVARGSRKGSDRVTGSVCATEAADMMIPALIRLLRRSGLPRDQAKVKWGRGWWRASVIAKEKMDGKCQVLLFGMTEDTDEDQEPPDFSWSPVSDMALPDPCELKA